MRRLSVVWVVLIAGPSSAQEALTFSAVRVVEHGKAVPSVTFHAGAAGSLRVALTCGGSPFSVARPVQAGASVTLDLAGLAAGTWDCAGSVVFTDAEGASGELPLAFQVASLPVITWTYAASDIDLAARSLVVHPSRAVRDATVTLITVGGAIAESVAADVGDPSNPRFSWSTPAEVVKLVVEGSDANGFRSQLELSPWSYQIPHEDVVFASGKSDLAAPELPKLEATWAETEGVLQKYGSVVEIQLYVAGYTDTVGQPGSNQVLSEQRARAIAAWFRQRGFEGAIWYQGFGEDAPAVPTADEVDQLANRRALYVLAAETPPSAAHLPRASWKRL